MRPLTLEIEGFTAFRLPVCLDLTDLDLFAITGPTGAGKSSLIDAICYALYGRVPRVTTEVASCIAQQADRMQVTLSFQAGSERYRVYRETRRRGQGNIRLEQWRGDDWHPVAERATQVNAEVIKIVGLDYDGFTRSVILPQGQFQEFLAGSLDKRRAVLRSLLRLDVYERMRSRASGMSSDLKTRIEERQRNLDDLADATPENITKLGEELEASRLRVAALRTEQTKLHEAHALAGKLNQARESLASNEAEVRSAATALSQTRAAAEDGRAALLALVREEEGLEEALAANPFDPDRYQALAIASERIQSLEATRENVSKVQQALDMAVERASQGEAAVEASRAALVQAESARASAESCLQDAQRDDEAQSAAESQREQTLYLARERVSTLVRTHADAEKARKTHADAEKQAKNAGAAVEARTRALQAAEEERQAAINALAEAQRHDLAATLQQGLKPGDACPVCGGVVGALAPMDDGGSLDTAEKQLRMAEKAASDAGASLNAASAVAAREAEKAESAGRQLARLEEEIENLVAAIADVLPDDVDASAGAIETALGALAQAREGRKALLVRAQQAYQAAQGAESRARERLIEVSGEATAARGEVQNNETHLASLRQQAESHHAALLAAVPAGVAAEKLSIEAALAEQQHALAARDEMESRLKDARQQVQAARQALEVAQQELAALELRSRTANEAVRAAEGQLQAARESLAASLHEAWTEVLAAVRGEADAALPLWRRIEQGREQEGVLLVSIGQMEARLERLRRDCERAEDIRKDLDDLKNRQNVAADLAQMLGSAKFQTFLQYEALRTLARDGSRRLETLSNGRYRLQVDDRGAEFEVIDQWNADQARSVRTLSGGETFLASLALSLALAESLPGLAANRRVLLESIFLDEGFGSLDPEALDRAADALDALRHENRMVCIVTHLQELAQRLPARIVVTRTEAGSSVSVA